ncbi:MAG TPA: zf-HC2 domain-containing protein [Thermoanaerobaculia bacterium]|nr:zf-HC2 domain-containing protein [Thermoanaerobaculia bacterium]
MNRLDDTLSCGDALDLLEPYVDGELAPAEAASLRSHVEGCPACARELALAERIQRELRSLPQLDCPPEIVERVRRQGAEVVPFRPRLTTRLPLRLAAAAALLALALGGGAFFVRHQQQEAKAAEVARATREARFALAYLGKVSRRTSLDVRDEVIVRRVALPVTRSISRSIGLSLGSSDPEKP